jgi:hypothetical protein
MPAKVLIVEIGKGGAHGRYVCEDLAHLRDFLATVDELDYLHVEESEVTQATAGEAKDAQ